MPDRFEAEHLIERVHFHDNYNVGPYLNNDIAVVQIKPGSSGAGIQFGARVSPVCLPPADLLYTARTNLTITGWGKVGYEGGDGDLTRTQSGNVRHLREGVVPIISKANCSSRSVYGEGRLSPGMFCAGHLDGSGADACQGDSGGPAVANVNGRATLLGKSFDFPRWTSEHEFKSFFPARAFSGITSWGYGCGRPNKPGVYTKVANYVAWINDKMSTVSK